MPDNNIVMPKQNAGLDRLFASLEIYNKVNWVKNDVYITEMRERFSELQNSNHSNIRKQSQIADYYGFLKNDNNKRIKIISSLGKDFLAFKNNNGKLIEILINSLNEISFGRNNTAVPTCNSIVEPPKLFLKAIYELEYLTKFEFSYLLYKIHKKELNDLNDINNLRNESTVTSFPL